MSEPINNDISNAIALDPAEGGATEGVDMTDATTQDGEPLIDEAITKTIWYEWTCPPGAAGPVTFATFGSTGESGAQNESLYAVHVQSLSGAQTYIERDEAVDDSWLEFDVYIPQATIDLLEDDMGFDSTTSSIFAKFDIAGNPVYLIFWRDDFDATQWKVSQSAFADDFGLVEADTWYTIKMHFDADTTNDLYLDGTLVESVPGGGFASSPGPMTWGPLLAFDGEEYWFDNIKYGTTEGGSEIFEDDFEDGDLVDWSDSGDTVEVATPPPGTAGTGYADTTLAVYQGSRPNVMHLRGTVDSDAAVVTRRFDAGTDIWVTFDFWWDEDAITGGDQGFWFRAIPKDAIQSHQASLQMTLFENNPDPGTFRITNNWTGGGDGTDSYGSAPSFGTWITVELHISGSTITWYVDGSVIFSGASGFSDWDNIAVDWNTSVHPSLLKVDNLTIGSSRGGTEYFGDDFSADLDEIDWPSVSGDVATSEGDFDGATLIASNDDAVLAEYNPALPSPAEPGVDYGPNSQLVFVPTPGEVYQIQVGLKS